MSMYSNGSCYNGPMKPMCSDSPGGQLVEGPQTPEDNYGLQNSIEEKLPMCNAETRDGISFSACRKISKKKNKGIICIRIFILLSVLFTTVLAIGLPFNMSVLYVEFLKEFEESNSKTSLVQSVCTGVVYTTGFPSGLMVSKFGTTKIGMAAGLLASGGLLLSYFSTSIDYLIVTIGLMTGIGASAAHITAPTCIGYWFPEKSRHAALSILPLGCGIAGFLQPLLLNVLVQEYGFRGTLLLLGGMMLNIFAFALLWGDPNSSNNNNVNANTKADFNLQSFENKAINVEEDENKANNVEEAEYKVKNMDKAENGELNVDEAKNKVINVEETENKVINVEETENKAINVEETENKAIMVQETKNNTKKVEEDENNLLNAEEAENKAMKVEETEIKTDVDIKWMETQTGFIAKNDNKNGNSVDTEHTLDNDINTSIQTIQTRKQKAKNIEKYLVFVVLRDLLGNKTYLLYLCAVSISVIPLNVINILMIDFLEFKGFTRNEAVELYMCIGVSFTTSIVLVAIGKTIPNVNVMAFPIFHSLLAAVALFTLPNVVSYIHHALLISCHGFGLGGLVFVQFEVTLTITGLKNYANGLGLLVTSMGICIVIGGPVAGGLVDTTGSYDVTFYAAGASLCVSSVLFAGVLILRKLSNRLE